MLAIAAAIAVLYGAGVRSLATRCHRWSAGRSISAGGAVASLAASAFVPTGTLTGHMVEHLLIGMVAPLLLALAAPVTLALQTAPGWLRLTIRQVLRNRAAVRLSSPIVGLIVFGASLVVVYLTPVLALSADHVVVHVAVHIGVLLAGVMFMWPIVAIDPIPHRAHFGARLLAVMAAVPFHAFLGIAIMSTTSLLAPRAYPSLADQHRAGGLLWVSGELMSFLLATIVVRSWLAADRRADDRADRRHDARDPNPATPSAPAA